MLVIPDMHLPFHDTKALWKVYAAIKKHKPDVVLQCGDLMDAYSWSRFPKRPDSMNPTMELIKARECAEEFWATIHKLVPRAKLFQLGGNHDSRATKLALERCPELYPLVAKSWRELFIFPNVETILDEREDLELDGVIYTHGHYTRAGQHLRFHMKPVVFGHLHRAFIHYEKIRNSLLWEMCIGHIANVNHPALSYTRSKYTPWVSGYGLIENSAPFFFPIA